MKLVLLACCALALSCSIDKRSDAFACTTTSECDSGRQCVDGFCVVTGGSNAPIDAPKGGNPDAPGKPLDAPGDTCPAQCTTCSVDQKTCNIDCTTTDCNNGTVMCPPGYACTIACGAQNACQKGIDCQQAKSCDIACSGRDSCQTIECGSGACDVMCSGPRSCSQTVDCGNSCACDVTCTGGTVNSMACQGADITCGQNDTCVGEPNGCSSTLIPGCDTCM
jgi:hypothetical protein